MAVEEEEAVKDNGIGVVELEVPMVELEGLEVEVLVEQVPIH